MQLILTAALVCAAANAAGAVCSAGLGCFPNGPPWNTPDRPVPPPRSRQDVGTYFTLFTRRTQYTGYNITTWPDVSLEGSDYMSNSTTIFIVQGLNLMWNITWLHRLKNNVLAKGDYNVILTRWARGDPEFNYTYYQGASDTRIVGAELARLGRFLIHDHNASPANFHVIAYSLGAQAAGYMGQNISGIGRITGLDASQAGFEGYSRLVRLDSTDAILVENIHTALHPPIPNLIASRNEPMGHVDFYVNGGNVQPGCNLLNKTLESAADFALLTEAEILNMTFCSHQWGVVIFLEATSDSDCVFWGRQRQASHHAEARRCRPRTCRPIGLDFHHSTLLGIFDVTTAATPPHCIPSPRGTKGRHTSK